MSVSAKDLEFNVSKLSFNIKYPKQGHSKINKWNNKCNNKAVRDKEGKNDTYSKISAKGSIDAEYGILSDNGKMGGIRQTTKFKNNGLAKVRTKALK